MTKPTPIPFDMLTLPAMLDHVRVGLRAARLPVFRMQGRLVYVFRWERASSDEGEPLRRDDNALVVEQVQEIRMHEYIIEHVPFVKFTQGGAVAVAPPASLAKHFMVAKDRWRFKVLNGVIQAPTMRADGSLLLDEGYDRASGLYLDTGGVVYPDIKDEPTEDDAREALALLKTPFEEFPFMKTDEFPPECPSLSVALSAILTGLIRRTLRSAPIHGFDADAAGAGKGLACSVVTTIVTGNHATAINFSTTDTEFRKLLFSALLANDQVIVLDNISRPLEGESLNTLLTEETMSDRILGVSQNAVVPTNVLLLANGNNLGVKGDTHRRIVAARILAGEHPEQRTFKRTNLLAYVEANRPALVAAGLTVLRAYEVAGRPSVGELTPFGSYEDWDARVRRALIWLGEADPCMTRERFKANDPDREVPGRHAPRAAHCVRWPMVQGGRCRAKRRPL